MVLAVELEKATCNLSIPTVRELQVVTEEEADEVVEDAGGKPIEGTIQPVPMNTSTDTTASAR